MPSAPLPKKSFAACTTSFSFQLGCLVAGCDDGCSFVVAQEKRPHAAKMSVNEANERLSIADYLQDQNWRSLAATSTRRSPVAASRTEPARLDQLPASKCFITSGVRKRLVAP